MNSTVTLSNELATYYHRVFLLNGNNGFVFDQGSQKSSLPTGEGKTIVFNKYEPLPYATTPLNEGESGDAVALNSTKVEATVKEYGRWSKISSLLSATSIDKNAKAKIELFRDNMYGTQDVIIKNELIDKATKQNVAGNVSVAAIKEAVATLGTNKAFKFSGGYYLGFVGPRQKKALLSDPEWLAPHQYKDTTNIYKGEIGSVHGVRFLESSTIEDGATTTYNVIIVGKEAYGTVDLASDKPKLYINGANVDPKKGQAVPFKQSGKEDPLGRYCTIGWAGTFTAKMLDAKWAINIVLTP